MKRLIPILLLFTCLTIFAAEKTESILIENQRINIPQPKGLTKVDASMQEALRYLEASNPPELESISYYIPQEDALALLNGESINLSKILALKHTPNISDINITEDLFNEFKKKIKRQSLEAILANQKNDVDAFLQKTQKDFNVQEKNSLSLSETPFKDEQPIIETKDTLTLSITTSYRQGERVFSNFVQMTYIHVGNKMLVLYASAPENEKQWAVNNSTPFIKGLLEANPQPKEENTLYTEDNLDRAVSKGIGGAIGPIVLILTFTILQGLFYLIKKLFKRGT